MAMRSVVALLAVSTAGFLSGGCRSTNDSTPGAGAGPGIDAELQGTWSATCSQVDDSSWQTATLSFSERGFTQIARGYASAACETVTVTDNFSGTFLLGSAVEAAFGATTVTAYELDISWPAPNPGTVYTLVYVDASATPHRIHLGIPEGENDGSSIARRRTRVGTWYLEKQPAPIGPGDFVSTGQPVSRHDNGHTATVLLDGTVLVAGGGEGYPGPWATNIAEIYDPSTGQFALTGEMTSARGDHTATLLRNGKVLVVGGDPAGYLDAEVFDPATGTFAPAGDPGRAFHGTSGTLLLDGTVLLAGGGAWGPEGPAGRGEHALLYDPGTHTFAIAGTTTVRRYSHTASLLRDGRVLLAGGTEGFQPLSSAEIFDPAPATTFLATGSMTAPRSGHTATVLPDGKVLIAGGFSGGPPQETERLQTAELYDPGVGTFARTGSMTTARMGHTATLLLSGKVLVEGGSTSTGTARTAELYDPETGTFSAIGPTVCARTWARANLLPNGTVLITGAASECIEGDPAAQFAELYVP